ncbi:GBA, partial [Symbiodinium pilosum]
ETCFGHERLAWLEDWYTWILPHRELQLENDDRELLIRLDWFRLTKDFQFKHETLAGGAIEYVRQRLRKLKQTMQGQYLDPDSDGLSDSEQSGPVRSFFDVLVGEETCQDGDINLASDPTLEADLADKVEHNLDDSEVQIVMLTVKSLAEVAVVQALTIFLVRTLTGENFSDFVNAMRITIQ